MATTATTTTTPVAMPGTIGTSPQVSSGVTIAQPQPTQATAGGTLPGTQNFASQFGAPIPSAGVTGLSPVPIANQPGLNTTGLGTAARFNPYEIRRLQQQGQLNQYLRPSDVSARELLGQFGQLIIGPGFNRTQLPFIEANLNFQNRQQAEADRAAALQLLGQQRQLIGQSPESMAAREAALARLNNRGNEFSLQESQIRQRGAIGLEDAQRALQQSLAQQGLGGSAGAFQNAQLQQAGARQVSNELQQLAIEQAMQQGEDINRLSSIASEEELRRVALGQAITDLLTAPRGEFDLSSLAAAFG